MTPEHFKPQNPLMANSETERQNSIDFFKDTTDALVQGILYLMDKPATTGPLKSTSLTKQSYWRVSK